MDFVEKIENDAGIRRDDELENFGLRAQVGMPIRTLGNCAKHVTIAKISTDSPKRAARLKPPSRWSDRIGAEVAQVQVSMRSSCAFGQFTEFPTLFSVGHGVRALRFSWPPVLLSWVDTFIDSPEWKPRRLRRGGNEVFADPVRLVRYDGAVSIRKAFRYRAYPTTPQISQLDQWSDALRFLWNLANEQRHLGLARPRCERKYPTSFDQINELTELRAELPWLAAVPRNVSAQVLVELDKAWQRCFAKLADAPRWKCKGDGAINLCEPHPKVWRLDDNRLHFPKIEGNIRVVVHRPLEGTPKTCTLTRDGDQWFVSIACEIERHDPAQRVAPIVAIDRGIANFGATSDGGFIPNPQPLVASLRKLVRAQRVVARRKKGSRNQKKAKLRVARIHRTVRRQRAHHLHVHSARLAKSHGIVVLEDLNVAGMIRGNCARSIADAGWSSFATMLRYKLTWSGGTLVLVPAAYSSQECSACGCVDAKSRRSQSVYCCTTCGYRDHADINAAKVLLHRANRSVLPVEGMLLEGARRSRKVAAVKLRNVRRPSRLLQSSGL